jgi:hypothetical protein
MSDVGQDSVSTSQLRAEGVEVNDDNEPLNEGSALSPPDEVHYQFIMPMHCPHHKQDMTNDKKDKWANHYWDKIATYTKMELFRMAFLEEFMDSPHDK